MEDEEKLAAVLLARVFHRYNLVSGLLKVEVEVLYSPSGC